MDPLEDLQAHRHAIPWNNYTEETAYLVKDTTMRAVVGVSCALSVVGSLLIILSYILFKNRRSKTRQILVNLSLMDLGVGLSNFIGLTVYFDQYYYPNPSEVPKYIDGLCKTQAFFAAFSTYGSIFWTIALAGYIYSLILQYTAKQSLCYLVFCYIICYGLPLALCLWLMFTHRLGYSPYDSAGWCALIDVDPRTEKTSMFVTVFAYDLWIYLAIVLIAVLYISIRFYIANHEQVKLAKKYVDQRFLLIPLIFVVLRIWTAIIDIVFIYAEKDVNEVPHWLNQVLLYLSGIGDSAQGFVNALLFVLFSKGIRESFIHCLTCKRYRSKELPGKNDAENARSHSQRTSVSSLTSLEVTPMLGKEKTVRSMKHKIATDSYYGSVNN